VASADEAVRRQAWHSLYGNLWHQGTIFEATAHAVPFFIELAEQQSVPDREWVLGYLVNLAKGTSFHDVHQSLEIYAEKRSTAEYQRQREKELEWVSATREAVRRGRRVYGNLLNDRPALVRTAAAHLLTLFPQHAAEHLAWIQARLALGESDEKARTWCVLAVGRLAAQGAGAASWLEDVLASDESEGVRVAAALGLAWNRGRALSSSARDLIARNARRPGPAAVLFEHLPWDEGNEVMQFYCSEALGLVRDAGVQSLESLIEAMNDVAPYQAIEIMRLLLDRVFGGRPMPRTATADRLSEEQRMVLQAISTSEKIWHDLRGKVLVSPVIGIMKEFGLPPNVVRLQAFLEGRITPRDDDWAEMTLAPARLTPEMTALMRKVAEEVKQIKKRPRNPQRRRDDH
jgi:hypothetical protein